MDVRLIILGAGKGTRMRSSRPKAMRVRVLDVVAGLSAARERLQLYFEPAREETQELRGEERWRWACV